jgi:hypothetical protein
MEEADEDKSIYELEGFRNATQEMVFTEWGRRNDNFASLP